MHRIKIIHTCFYPILSWFQFYSPHSLSLTKFLSPPGSRDLPSGPPGSQPPESLRSAPSPAAARGGLPSSRPPVWCLGLRALPGREPAPRRTPGTSGASGRPGGRGPPGAVCAAPREPPSGRREPVLPGECWRLPRRLRFGLRARGRAPETGGDSGNVTGAMRHGRSLLSPEIRAAGPRPGRAAAVVVAARPGGPARREAPSARGHRRGS